MKFPLKNKIALAIGTAVLSVSMLASTSFMTQQRAEAQIPVTDIGALVQMIQSAIMRQMESQIMQALKESGLDMMGLFSEMEIDNINNAFANMIARTGRALQDIQNMEQLEKSMPAQDVCDTIELSVSLDEMLCDMESATARYNAKNAGRAAMMSGRGSFSCQGDVCTPVDRAPTGAEVRKFNQIESKNFINECDSLKAATGRDVCLEASLTVNPPPQGATVEEYKAIEAMNKLAAGVQVVPPRVDAVKEKLKGIEGSAYNELMSQDMRETYFKRRFESTLHHITLLKEGTLEPNNTRKPGEIINLERYLSTRLGSHNWLCEVTNSCDTPETNAQGEAMYVSPAELDKRKAQMDAVLLYIGMQQYKSMLRIERSLAELALMELNPPAGGAK